MRNRYRLQFAIVLASIPDIAVSTIADEVGYSSATALARAFANAGLPAPGAFRDQLRTRGGSIERA
jgi:AraC-like DNA-binding protein